MDWLFNEAVSTYIVFFLGLILGFLFDILRFNLFKLKPSILRVEREKVTSLINISPEAQARLNLVYNKNKDSIDIEEFWQSNFSIKNTGDNPVTEVSIRFMSEKAYHDDILEISINDPIVERESSTEVKYTAKGNIYIQFTTEYLNPYKDFEDSIEITVYSPKQINIKNVNGGGVGWGTKYFDRATYNERLEKVAREADNIFELAILKIMIRLFSK